MVLLTMTPSIVEALEKRNTAASDAISKGKEEPPGKLLDGEPSLKNPAVGNPISHGQIIDLWKGLRRDGHEDCRLETLLRGARIYVPPPPPKPEPTDEYKALMARLRREEEQRAYERMANPLGPTDTFAQRFPSSSAARAFAEVNRPHQISDLGDDDITYNDVHRQVMLIVNFLASILGVAGALWALARWWSTPARVFLALGGSITVGIVEVVLYAGYVWHLGEAKKKDSRLREAKEVVQTWVVGGDEAKAGDNQEAIVSRRQDLPQESSLRRRKQKEPG